MQSTHRSEMTIPGKIIASYGGRCVKQITGNIGREGTINLLRAGEMQARTMSGSKISYLGFVHEFGETAGYHIASLKGSEP